MDLFDQNRDREGHSPPLAERMRPRRLDQLVGQRQVTEKGGLLQQAIEKDTLFSIILWGPPGCGKTTLAAIIANETAAEFVQISAVLTGIKEVKEIIKKAEERRKLYKKKTILFVDEIHRFNKAQQDAFLYHVEKGFITLVGATTENPSFEVIPALVSRCMVVDLNPLAPPDIKTILKTALEDTENGLGSRQMNFSGEALDLIADMSDGDARVALTTLETAADHFSGKSSVAAADVAEAVKKKALTYDKSGDAHFNLISAFHKSLRGSDPDAALYWLERMLQGGEDPFYIIRRMVRFATEDVGIADPGALTAALNAKEAFRFLGSPEGDEAVFQAAIYLATAPKSNAVYTARKKVKDTVENTGSCPVPLHIRNAPTRLMAQKGYARGYKYAHDYTGAYTVQEYLPETLAGRRFYFPSERGYEGIVKKRVEKWRNLKKESK